MRHGLCCIYKITNIQTTKVYIGSAVNFRSRLSTHKTQLKENKHHSIHLQRAWNKYGEYSFTFSLIEFVKDKTKLLEREQFWLDVYQSAHRDYGYNISPTAGSSLGVKRSPEVIKRVSEAHKGIRLSDEAKQKLSKHWKGHIKSEETRRKLSEANKGKKMSEESRRKMSEAMKGRVVKPETIAKILKTRKEKGIRPSEETKKKMSLARSDSYNRFIFISPDGVIYEGENLSGFCREHDLSQSNMLRVLKGLQKFHKGWTCPKYKFNEKTYKLKSPEGTILEFKSIKDFCITQSLSYNAVSGVLSGKQKNHKGWTKAE